MLGPALKMRTTKDREPVIAPILYDPPLLQEFFNFVFSSFQKKENPSLKAQSQYL